MLFLLVGLIPLVVGQLLLLMLYRAAMARKLIKNINMLQHVKRATFSRFIRKIVNIYWLILVVVGVVGWFLFWLLFKSSHCVD